MSADQAPIVVIGTGLAGYNLVKEFRKLDAESPVMMITADDGRNYSKPMLSTGFGKGKTADQLAMADAVKMADQLNVIIRTNTQVTAIDAEQHTLFIGEEPVQYAKLVLAWGAEVVAPRVEGDAEDHIFSINDLQDYASFRAAAEGKKNVLIMGAGLIGCEYANDLTAGDFQVTLVAPSDQVLPGLLPAPAANAVQRGLESLGTQIHLGPLVTRINKNAQGSLDVVLSNGNEITSDIIVSAIGLRPRVDLAVKAGIQVNRGIVTDRSLATSAADVFAVGDCAEVDGHSLMYVLPLMASARALAKTLNGEITEVKYGVMPVGVKTPVVPVAAMPPAQGAQGEWQISEQDNNVRAEYRDAQGKLLGYALTGDKVSDKLALNKELTPLMS